MSLVLSLTKIAADLRDALVPLQFSAPVTHVYNPLEYAWKPYNAYLKRFGRAKKVVLLFGMNPGPWGMAQTGIPFGEVATVRDWLGIRETIGKPDLEHPKRPVQGLDCPRSEVSGRRLWGWARESFGTPENFFKHFLIVNYCPLLFLEESGRNRTPDKLPASELKVLLEQCDQALRNTVLVLQPDLVVGIGKFAEKRAVQALSGMGVRVGSILHPSPASPAANRGWAAQAEQQLRILGVALDDLKRKQQRISQTLEA